MNPKDAHVNKALIHISEALNSLSTDLSVIRQMYLSLRQMNEYISASHHLHQDLANTRREDFYRIRQMYQLAVSHFIPFMAESLTDLRSSRSLADFSQLNDNIHSRATLELESITHSLHQVRDEVYPSLDSHQLPYATILDNLVVSVVNVLLSDWNIFRLEYPNSSSLLALPLLTEYSHINPSDTYTAIGPR